MSRTYAGYTCFYCKKRVSVAGCARVAHMRKHVREGLLVEAVTRDAAGNFVCRSFHAIKKDK